MAKNTKQARRTQEKKFRIEFASQMLALATSSFGLVAALAWNDTIQQAVKEFIEPRIPGSGLMSRFLYAVLVSILAIAITYQLSQLHSHLVQKGR